MDEEPTIREIPPLDTGIGREAGYANDAEFIAAVEAERAAMPPDVRDALERADYEFCRRFLGL